LPVQYLGNQISKNLNLAKPELYFKINNQNLEQRKENYFRFERVKIVINRKSKQGPETSDKAYNR
jgi:hypothetical protein